MIRSARAASAVVAAALVAVPACSSDGPAAAPTTLGTPTSLAPDNPSTTAPTSPDPPSTTAPTTTSPTTTATTTAPPTTAPTAPVSTPPDPGDPIALLTALASDDLLGRDNATPDSEIAQGMLITRLSRFAEPWNPAAGDIEGYRQRFAEGANVIGVVQGTDLADEYVMVGAHYDHLGVGDCRLVTADDEICNGAVDNASGTAAAMAIGAALAAESPRRSIIVVFWDAEEDGLLGSSAFVDDPVVPLDRIVASVNFDMQGSRLLPSLANHTVAVGAETGGQALVDLLAEVTSASTLEYASLSLIMGQGRSDHAPLAAAGVPVVFFTDSTNGCYHSADDEMAVVDLDKLGAQIATVTELVRRLADGTPIAFDAAAATTNFGDAEQLLALARAGEPDLGLVEPATAAQSILDDLQSVVDAGAAGYDAAAEGTVLGAAARLVDMLTNLDCELGIPD